jgi:ferrous iron transport protein A
MKQQPVPLTMLGPREEGTIAGLRGGRGFVSRIATLGFIPGASLCVVQNYGRGPLIVSVRGAKVALGRGEAAHIMVYRGEIEQPPGG